MLGLLRLFAIAIVVMGAGFLLNPNLLKSYIAFWRQRKRLYMGAVISLLFGILCLSVASQCKLRGVIVVLGIWSLIKAVMLSTIGVEKAMAMLDWWGKRPTTASRFMGLVAMGIGVLILYSI